MQTLTSCFQPPQGKQCTHARHREHARTPTHSGIPVAKSTGKPDRRYSTDGWHGATGDENAQAPAPLIPEMIQVMRRSARISKTGAPLQGQHTNADADSGSSTPPDRIGLHGGTPNKAGATNNHATRQSTAKLRVVGRCHGGGLCSDRHALRVTSRRSPSGLAQLPAHLRDNAQQPEAWPAARPQHAKRSDRCIYFPGLHR